MAEAQAGQGNAQQQEGDTQQADKQQGNDGQGAQDGADGGDGQQPKGQQAARTYSQEELDRILGKVRKNARYLGRKEAESELRSQGATAQQARDTVDRQQQQAKDEGPPEQKDGESWEQFIERKAEYAGRKAAREERERGAKEDGERKAAEQRTTTEREFKKRAAETKKDIPDLYDVLESAEDVMISNVMGEAIQESPIGPRILYHLVKNPEEAARIAGLSPTAAAREIGKLEAKLEAGITKAPAPKEGGEDGNDDTQGDGKGDGAGKADDLPQRRGDGTFKPAKKPAPDPIEPGSARSANANAAPSDKDDMKTWVAKREAEEAAKRRGRK
jgi:hypothetical protein